MIKTVNLQKIFKTEEVHSFPAAVGGIFFIV